MRHEIAQRHKNGGYRQPGKANPFDLAASENYGHTVRVGFYTTYHVTKDGPRNVGGSHAVTPDHVIDAMRHYYQTGEIEIGFSWDDTPYQMRILRGKA